MESPLLDARLILEAAAGVTRSDLLTDPHAVLGSEAAGRYEALIARRADREPISQIVGRKAFWTLMLGVGPSVLSPRPETEAVVEAALGLAPADRPIDVLDLGVGSGAILLSILAERPQARGLGVDVSEEALAVARDNAARLGLANRLVLLRGDWGRGLAAGAFDLVVANPPYIPTADIEALDPEVRSFEPRVALDGGPDGLAAYRRLAPETIELLRPGGGFAFEVGPGQLRPVEALLGAAGAVEMGGARDLDGRERVVFGRKKSLGNQQSSR